MVKSKCEKCRANALKEVDVKGIGVLVLNKPLKKPVCKLSENLAIEQIRVCPIEKFILNNIWFKLEHLQK